jgi:cobalt/nickel transport system ATP-binding protein
MTPDIAIQIHKLSYNYPDGQRGLKNVDLSVHRGESVAIIGPNGAGKSTLLLHLNGILRSSADIEVCGLKMEDRNLREIRKKVGMVFQDPEDQLFSLSVYDDVAFGPLNMGYAEKEVSGRVAVALGKVGMNGFEKRSSHHLSIGEKKRVAIATVLSLDPELLVLDEPTGSLDPRGKGSLISLLEALPVTRIIASHDLDLVGRLCSRTVLIDCGSIAADGETGAILGNEALLAAHGLARN